METKIETDIDKPNSIENGINKNNSLSDEDATNENQNDIETAVRSRRRYRRKPKIFFYIGGGNGVHLVDENLTALGWERIHDKTREDYKLKWCEVKSHNYYSTFREGEQLVYQIPNNKLLTTKIGLLTTLQEYDRVMNKVKKGRPRQHVIVPPKIMKYQDFLPETYRIDVKDDREMFYDIYVDGELWISKPTGMNQGKGIYLIRNREDIQKMQERIAENEDDVQSARKLPFKIPMARIVQRYVTNPLLLDQRKFDVRNYMIVACTNPLVVFYRDGYCRLTCLAYDPDSLDLTGHLTNQFMQKKNPLYNEVKEDTVWSMDRFNDYVNCNFKDSNNLPEDWVHTVLRKRCQQIMLHCFQAVRHKLECKLGFFDLIGCDFLVDDQFKISLLEMNCNPALHTNCETLKDIIPDIVSETLKLALEIFDKANKRERIIPLTTQHNCVLMYNGDVIEAAERRERLQSAAEARRRARSAQRRKKFVPGQYIYRRTAVTTSAETQQQIQTTTTSPTATTPLQTTSAVTSQPAMTTARSNLPSSQVVASTAASNQRVVHSKSTPNVALKPFYAGGTVASRPYSAPKFNKKYAQIESRIFSHNNSLIDSPRRAEMNNAALNEASNSKVINLTRNVVLSPSRNEINSMGEEINNMELDEEFIGEIRDELEALEREKIFEQVLAEEGESAEDNFCDDEQEDDLIDCNSPEAIRRPSAKLPSSYHRSSIDGALLLGTASTWPRHFQAKHTSVRKRVSRIASLSVKGNFDLPMPSVGVRQSLDISQKIQFRAPTTVRLRQSLQATTCTLDIGPNSRRGLIAIPNGVGGRNLLHKETGRIATKLKLVKSPPHGVSASDILNDDSGNTSSLHYLASAHVTQGQSIVESNNALRNSFPPVSNNGTNDLRSNSDSSPYNTTNRRSRTHFNGEEKVIWRLRSRTNDFPLKDDGPSSPKSQHKVTLSVPVVTQSPGLILPRKLVETARPGNNSKGNLPSNSTKHRRDVTTMAAPIPREAEDLSLLDDSSFAKPRSTKNHKNPLSKVVAVATAAPTHYRPQLSNDFKENTSGSEFDEHNLVTAG